MNVSDPDSIGIAGVTSAYELERSDQQFIEEARLGLVAGIIAA